MREEPCRNDRHALSVPEYLEVFEEVIRVERHTAVDNDKLSDLVENGFKRIIIINDRSEILLDNNVSAHKASPDIITENVVDPLPFDRRNVAVLIRDNDFFRREKGVCISSAR